MKETETETESSGPPEPGVGAVPPANLVTVKQASEITNRTKSTINLWITSAQLQSYPNEDGTRMVSRAAVVALAEAKPHRTRLKQHGNGNDAAGTDGNVAAITPLDHTAQPFEDGAAASIESPVGQRETPSAITCDRNDGAETVDAQCQGAATPIAPEEQMVEISTITFDEAIQVRERPDEKVVKEYSEKMRAGEKFPPVTLFSDGTTVLLADGWHRLLAAKANGYHHFPAAVFAGGRHAAIRFALKANVTHGKRLTSADKRKKIRLALGEFPSLSNTQIAEICAVSESLVRSIRDSFVESEPAMRIGKDGKMHPAKRAPQKGNQDRREKVLLKSASKQVRKLSIGGLRQLQQVIAAQLAKLEEEPPAMAA